MAIVGPVLPLAGGGAAPPPPPAPALVGHVLPLAGGGAAPPPPPAPALARDAPFLEILTNTAVRTGFGVDEVEYMWDEMVEEIMTQLSNGKRVKLNRFGTLSAKRGKKRVNGVLLRKVSVALNKRFTNAATKS